MSARKTFFRFSEDQVGGEVILTVFAFLSTACILSVGIRLVYLALRSHLHQASSRSKEYAFFRTQLGYLAACLLIANAFNSIAGLLGVPFLVQQGISPDSVCLAQAFINQFGNISNAYFTSALVLHTFGSLVLRKRRGAGIYVCIIVTGWISAALFAALPLILKGPSGPMYGPSGIACDLRGVYAKEQFLLHLLPIFLAAVTSAICFSLIFLVIRGTLVVKGGLKLQFDPEARSRARKGEYHRFITGLAKNMLWFPAAYVLLLVPYSVTRLVMLAGFTVPFQAVIFAFSCWYSLGIVNVLLLYNTFRLISPAFTARMDLNSEETRSFSSAERGLTKQQTMLETPAPFISTMLPYPERAVSVSSYYDYPSIQKGNIGRKIAPTSALGRESFISGDPSRLSIASSPLGQHIRFESVVDPSMGLPIPPRRLSPPLFGDPSSTSSKGKGKAPMTIDPFRSSSGSELDISSWLSRQNPDGSMPRGIKNQPMLSAVGPSFSPNELPR